MRGFVSCTSEYSYISDNGRTLLSCMVGYFRPDAPVSKIVRKYGRLGMQLLNPSNAEATFVQSTMMQRFL